MSRLRDSSAREAGAIPFRRVGKHRGIGMEDVMAYKARDDLERDA